MTSVRTLAAVIAVIAVVVCAIVAYAILSQNGSDTPGGGGGTIGDSVSESDTYTIESVYTDVNGTETKNVTQYEALAVDGDIVTVRVTEDGVVTGTVTQTQSEFLDNIRSETPTGQYQRSDTIPTGLGNVLCDIYYDEAVVGNSAIGVSTYEWIGRGTNVIYQVQITITTASGTEIYTTTLRSTNMIEDSGGSVTGPTIDGTVRTDLQVGDYIEFSKVEDDGDRDIERYTVMRIDGNTVWYSDDFDLDDWERTTVEGFLRLLIYSGTGTPDRTETISTAFGDVPCLVYELDRSSAPWMDRDESVTLWVGQSNGVIYRMEASEYEDGWFGSWRDDFESYYLTGTSLFSDSSPSGDGEGTTPSGGIFGVEVTVGDSYTIRDDDDRHDKVVEVIAIDGNRLIVRETEGYDVDIERMSVDEFLSDIMVTDGMLSMLTRGTTDVVNGVTCTSYTGSFGDDRFTIWVDSDNVVWLEEEHEGFWTETTTLIELNIAALA